MNGFSSMLRGVGPGRLLMVAGTAIAFIALLVAISSRLTTPHMALLYGDLETSDASQVVAKLEALGIPYEITGNGRQILVPRDQALRMRMSMAEEGIPSGGSVGYEIFDDSSALGSTSFIQNVNLIRALEGELARTIRSLAQVHKARVHLVMPQRELFSRDRQEPTASVVVQPRGNATLTKEQVAAIQHLLATAVPALKPTRVSVVDDKGRLLARGTGEGENGADTNITDDLRSAHEAQVAHAIESLLEDFVGVGQARARVSVDMDFDRITTTAEIYDPDGQVVRSTQTVEENADSKESSGEQPVTVGGNLPDGVNAGADGSGSSNRSARTEETVNYEITKTLKNHVRESGTVKRMSIAVLVNGTYKTAEDGTRSYTPRTAEDMAQIERLVRSTAGFDAARGDTIEIVNLQFADSGAIEALDGSDPLIGLSKNDYFRIAEIFVLVIVTLLVILLVIRPLVTRIIASIPPPRHDEPTGHLLADQSGGAAPQLAAPTEGMAQPDEAPAEDLIDMAQVKGRIRSSTVKKVGQMVDHHPEESLSIIRKWMYQET